jgi:membrane protease YdiL (CAAX protease family)
VVANIAVSVGANALAHAAGVPWDELGLDRRNARAGLGTGVLASVPVVTVVGALSASARTRRAFDDDRVANASAPAFDLVVRIPFGTALSEELLFRGAVLGVMSRDVAPPVAVAATSAIFGAWHVLPALDAWSANAQAGSRRVPAVGVVAGNVVATSAAGVAFAWLRRRSGSVLAPAIVHAALNGAGYVAARRAARGVMSDGTR